MKAVRRTLAATLSPAAMSLLLSGCFSGVLGGKPAQMYRFGALAAMAPAQAPGPEAAPGRSLVLATPVFAPEVAGTRLLTTRGGEASYLHDSRWVAPAVSLFAAALKQGFVARGSGVAVVDRRGGAEDDVLEVSVDRFEAAYPGDERSPPTVRISGEARLSDGAGAHVARYRIAALQPANADRVGPAVAAFDGAVAQVVAGVVDWAARVERARPVASVRPASSIELSQR